jgi:hypothetical protein
MTLNASRVIAQKPPNAVVIDLSQIEEGRVILISRPPLVLDAEADNNDKAFLQALVDNRWLALGTHWPMVRCLKFFFACGRDTRHLREIFARHPSADAMGATVTVWPQWLSKGVVP